MTKCSWKLKSIFWAGFFVLLPFVSLSVSYAAGAASNAVVDQEVESFKNRTLATDAEKAKLKQEYLDAKEKCNASLENTGFWIKVRLFQQFDVSWYAASANFNTSESFSNWKNYLFLLRNGLDSMWENMEGQIVFSGFINTLEDIKNQIEYYHDGALENAKTQDEIQRIEQQYKDIKAKYDELMEATAAVREACEIANSFDSDIIKSINSNDLYKYIYCPAGVDPDKDPGKCSTSYFRYTTDETAETVYGNMRGCVPLPVKMNEGKSCIFCPLFLKIFNAANLMATQSYGILSISLANVMLVGFALWIAFSLLGKVSSFTKMDAPKYITELLTQAFKVLVAFLLLRDANAIYEYALGPLLKGGMEFGMTLLAGSNKYMDSCKSLGVEEMPINGLLPSYLYTQLECFIKAVQAELAVPQAIGSSLMCVSFNSDGIDPGAIKYVTDYRLPNLSMLFEGLIIWVFAWLLSLAFAFYLIDATVRLGIVGALMPFLIACWPFKITSKYTSQGFTMFMNTFFTYVFMGLVVSINIQLISVSMTGVQGGKDAVIAALNSNKITDLTELLDIGFAGFLILIASSIFGFKLCGQAAELAGSMAGGGGGSSIAPEIGGMGYNVAKAATLGAGKTAWQGTKLVGNATGVTPKLRQARDKAVSALGKVFSFGRSGGGKSSAPVSRLRGSDAPAPAPSSSSSGGASPVTAEQSRQAERVENAAPRPTTPAKPVTAANTAKPNQAGAEGTAPTSPEAARERQIDQFNRKQAAGLDLANNSEIYKQVSERCGQATANRDAAAQRARNFEAQAKEEKDKATALRQKAQSMADGAEKDAVMRQAGSSDQKADEFTAQAAEERKNEKENDAIVQENLKKMDEMQKEREQSISDKEIDSIMKQRYGNNYRTEQSANINGWNFK